MAAVLAFLWGATARADVVPPPATNCPTGSVGATCHGGPYCAPKKCTDYASCASGLTCQPVKFCINKLNCTGGWGTSYADEVVGSCEGGAPCSKGTCQTVVVCLPPTTKDQGPIKDRPAVADRPVTDRPAADRPLVVDRPVAADRPTAADRQPGAEQPGGTPGSGGCNCSVAETSGGGLALAGLIAVVLMLGRRRSRRG
jgi:MYXO-CTERM domain-containing protein